MPYAPAQLVLLAVAALEGAHPLAVVTFPALLRAAKSSGRDPVTDGVPYGQGEETVLLDDYFRLPRPPDPDRPWRAPWSAQQPWQKRKYPGGGLQRLRTDAHGRGHVLSQTKKDAAAGRRRDVWRLTPAAGAELVAHTDSAPVRLVDLALWFGREQDVADIDGLMTWFNHTFEPQRGDLVGTVYSEEIPREYRVVPFAPDPIDDSTAQQLGSLPPAPTVEGTLPDLVDRLETRLTNDGYQPGSCAEC